MEFLDKSRSVDVTLRAPIVLFIRVLIASKLDIVPKAFSNTLFVPIVDLGIVNGNKFVMFLFV